MRMMDNVSAISFTRHTRSLGITASMDVLNFIKPLPVSHSVCIETMISGVGKKSAEVFTKVIGENLATGERYLDATAFLTFVIVEENLKSIPAIEAETDEDRYVMAGYSERRKNRLVGRTADHEFQEKISIKSPWQ